MIEERTGLPGVVVGSDKERDEAEMLLERARAPRRRALVGNTVPEMAALIRGARLLLANNSGPMHLADAVHTPMVVLYSGTEWLEQWRPRSAPARLLRREVNCSPCFAFRCPFDHECLDVPAEAVLSASLEMLASGGGE